MNKIKVIVKNIYTKRDLNGNIYWATEITNTNNGQLFVANSAHESNILSLLRKAGFGISNIYTVSICTGSARLSSLPTQNVYLNECRYTKEWKKALNRIGFRGLATPEKEGTL